MNLLGKSITFIEATFFTENKLAFSFFELVWKLPSAGTVLLYPYLLTYPYYQIIFYQLENQLNNFQ